MTSSSRNSHALSVFEVAEACDKVTLGRVLWGGDAENFRDGTMHIDDASVGTLESRRLCLGYRMCDERQP